MADIIDFEDRRKKKLDGQGTAPTDEDLGLRDIDSEAQDEPLESQSAHCVISEALTAFGKKPTQAEQLIELARKSATFFHTPSNEPFGCITIGDHQETWPLRSKPFRMWLLRLLYESIGKMPHNKALEDASTQLQGDALFKGPCHEVFIRFASHGEAIYVDLADHKWDQIEITKQGWKKVIAKDSPVKFMMNFDNLSGLPDWLSDALCRIATGSGFGTRTLYTDDSEFLFSATRPIIMNGISDVATRHDLADRCVIVHLPPIKTGSCSGSGLFRFGFRVGLGSGSDHGERMIIRDLC